MLKWSIFAILTGFLGSHIPFIINYSKVLATSGHFTIEWLHRTKPPPPAKKRGIRKKKNHTCFALACQPQQVLMFKMVDVNGAYNHSSYEKNWLKMFQVNVMSSINALATGWTNYSILKKIHALDLWILSSAFLTNLKQTSFQTDTSDRLHING